MATTKTIQSIERAFAVLEMFQDHKTGEISLKELSDHLQINKSTMFGIVNTLLNLGYLKQNEYTQQYSLGYRFLSFSDSVKAESVLLRTAHPYLIKLSEKYQETVHLAVEKHGKVIYLDKVTSPRSISINSQVGKDNWMHCTGVGKCLLAYLPEKDIEDILAGKLPVFTPNTIASPQALKKELAKIRENGFALDQEEFELGLTCIAVPIFNSYGKVCCAISVSGLTPRIHQIQKNEILKELKQVSEEISQQL